MALVFLVRYPMLWCRRPMALLYTARCLGL